jgi:hypothetical protein
MNKNLLTAMALSGLMVIGSACSRQGDARETTRDTTAYQRTPTDTNTMRDTSMMRDTSRMRDSLRDTTPANRQRRP